MPRPCGAFRQNSLEHSQIFFVGRVDPNRARKFQESHDLHFLFATLGQPVIFVSVNADFRHRSIEMLTDYRLGYGIDCQLRVNIPGDITRALANDSCDVRMPAHIWQWQCYKNEALTEDLCEASSLGK
jgi:hypothetical protein